MNVPKLRFGEFNKEWNRKELGDIAQFSKGKGIAKADISKDGQFECIRYGELYTQYKETIKQVISRTNLSADELVFSEANDVIIPASGETQLDIATASCVLKKGVALGGDLNIIKSDANGVFLSYYLNNAKKQSIANLAQGISVVHLYASQLKTLELNVPNSDEQQKIADFLSVVDAKITALTTQKTALTQYKQGMMQRIFSQTLRFKDDNGADYPDWEEMRLGDLLDYEQPTKYLVSSTDYQDDYPTPVLTAGKTFILGYTNEQGGIFTNLPVIIFDDFTTANKFVNFPFKAKSSAMKMLKNDPTKSNLRFIYETMQLLDFATGDEHKRYWISEYQEEFIFAPCLEEQTKIAQFLTELDNKINAVDAQIQSAQQWKQGLLQQMFV